MSPPNKRHLEAGPLGNRDLLSFLKPEFIKDDDLIDPNLLNGDEDDCGLLDYEEDDIGLN